MKVKLLIVILAFCTLILAGQVKFYGGKTKKIDNIELTGDKAKIDNETHPKSDISEVVFASKTKTSTAKVPQEQFDTDSLLSIADSVSKIYPDVPGIILFDCGEQILNSDGTRKYRYHFAGKILKSSMLSWGTRSLYINEGRNTAKVLFARSISPDGTVLYADTSKAKIAPITEGKVSFGHGDIYTLVIPGVQEGSIVEYIYETDTYNPYDTALYSPGWYFQDENPVYFTKVLIRLPKPKKLFYIFKNPPGVFGSVLYLGTPDLTDNCLIASDKLELDGFAPDQMIYADTTLGRWVENSIDKMRSAKPKIVDEDTSTAYIWEYKNMPPLISEPKMPSFGDVTPHIGSSVQPKWDYVFDWLGNFQKTRIKLTPEIENKVKEITAGANTIEEKIDRIYRWAQRKIQYISIKGSVSSGQTGHPADETFKNGYGDCTDKSIIFCTMLKAIGIEAHPIIIMTNGSENVDRCIPNTGGNHAITKVFMPDGKEIFLDATSSTYKFPYFRSDDRGVSYVDAIGKTVGIIPENPPEDMLEHVEVAMKIDENGNAVADFKSTPYRMLEAAYRGFWEWQQPERYQQIFENWMNSIFPQANLDTFALIGLADMDSQLVEWAQVSVDSFPVTSGDMWVFTIPGIERSMNGFEEVNLEKRKFDIEYTCPRMNEYSVEIELPKEAKIVALPQDVELACEPYADFSLTFEKKGHSVRVYEKFRLKKRVVPASDFQKYKKFIIAAKQAAEKRLFVEKP
ncbi:DUF3857 and transglutaminase domain-containing protein [bacterium]|nr:DUF3857 and transglutaminase domain-containing protein [bacterium]